MKRNLGSNQFIRIRLQQKTRLKISWMKSFDYVLTIWKVLN